MLEKIKLNLSKKKIFVVGLVISIALLLGGSVILSKSDFPDWIKIVNGEKVIDIKKFEKEFAKLFKEFDFMSSKEWKRLLKEGKVGVMEEVKEETPVIEHQECKRDCGIPCDFWELTMVEDQRDKVKDILENAVAQCPEGADGYYWRKKLAYHLWDYYNEKGKDPAILEQAIKEAEQALDLNVGFHLPRLLSELLAESKDVKRLDRIFEKILATEEGRERFYVDYIVALTKMDDPRTEEVLKKAIEEKFGGDYIVLIYTKWLLDKERENEVLLLPGIEDPTMYFYRGVALERIGQLKEAKSEYAKYRAHYKIENLPNLPKRFQIPGSELQKEMQIRFEGDESSMRIQSTTAISDAQAIKGLSYLIYGEAQGETLGGMRAVGWIVRSRVLRGSIGPWDCRLGVDNTGSTLAEQYRKVMCQSDQFDGMCKEWCNDPNTTQCPIGDPKAYERASTTAKAVYNGEAPDPVGQHCPGGITNWGGSYCADSTKCTGYYKNTYRLAGPVLNYGTDGSCPSPHPGIKCGPSSVGKTCGNGGSDNCFYPKPEYCVGSGCVTHSGSISQPGRCVYPPYFYSSVTGYHKGHLEGPEGNYNLIDFDLYFWKWNGSSWQQVASSIRYGSVDDINYYGTPGYYIWGICAYTGSGSYMLYTSRPQ